MDNTLLIPVIEYRIMLCSSVIQALDGKSDWKLTINYYNYCTGDLIKSDIIR